METTYRLKIEPERDSFVGRRRSSPREKSFRGVTSEYERGYISLSRRWGSVKIGRDYLNWGNGREEGLLMSMTAGSIDQIYAKIRMNRFTLCAMHAMLDAKIPRRLAGHRLTVRLPEGIYLGVGETVLYTRRGFDFAYLLPVGAYYANQYNEKDDDNILWSIDWKIPIMGHSILYGELLIDDFQYERDEPAPDRLGFNITGETLFEVGGRDVELLAGYTSVDIFTYAHKDSLLTRYVTGDGDASRNTLLGSAIGPDSDIWIVRASVPVHRRALIALSWRMTRRGESNDLREWNRVEDPDPDFPSGALSIEREYILDGSIDLGKGSFLYARGGAVSRTGPSGKDDDLFVYLGLLMDF